MCFRKWGLFCYRKESLSKESLESMMGQPLDLYDITVSERDSFQNGDESIFALEAIAEDTCFLCNVESDNLERINMRNKIKKHRYRCKWCLCNRQWWYVCHWQ